MNNNIGENKLMHNNKKINEQQHNKLMNNNINYWTATKQTNEQ